MPIKTRRRKRGIEPLIAAVILVAVAIALAVAVAFWMSGIIGGYTKYEQLEVSAGYADWNEDDQTWIVVLQVKNTGSSDATIDEIYVNGRPHDAYLSIPNSAYGYSTQKLALTARDLALLTTNTTTIDTYPYLMYFNSTSNSTYKYVVISDATTKGLKHFDFTNGVPLKSGDQITIVILIEGPGHTWPNNGGTDFKHGATVEFRIHTSAGRDYPKSISLP